MAICRCLARHSPPATRQTTTPYVGYVYPVGYPNTAAICGREDPLPCNNPAVIWLTNNEMQAYAQGIRIFSVDSRKVKIMAV